MIMYAKTSNLMNSSQMDNLCYQKLWNLKVLFFRISIKKDLRGKSFHIPLYCYKYVLLTKIKWNWNWHYMNIKAETYTFTANLQNEGRNLILQYSLKTNVKTRRGIVHADAEGFDLRPNSPIIVICIRMIARRMYLWIQGQYWPQVS